jgi:hypothetical protein
VAVDFNARDYYCFTVFEQYNERFFVNNTGLYKPLDPLLSLTAFAELESKRAKLYWDYLGCSNREQILMLRDRSRWSIRWLSDCVPGGEEIATGMEEGESCERGYVTLLDSFSPELLEQILKQAFVVRQSPHYASSERVEELLKGLLSSANSSQSESQIWDFVRGLAVGDSSSLLAVCRSIESTILQAKGILWFPNQLEEHLIATMLLELTAWGNVPDSGSPWWKRYSNLGFLERFREGDIAGSPSL